MAISGVAFGSWLAYRLCEQYLSKEFFNALSTKLGDAFVSNLSKSIEQAIDNLCSEKQITGATMTLTEFCDIFLPLCVAAHMSSARASEALSTLFILTDTKEMSTITWKELTERLLDCIRHIRSNQDVTYMSKNQDSSQLDWYISAKNTSDNVPRGDSSLRVQMSLCEATGSLYVLAAREIMRFNFFTWDACQVLTDADSEMISTSNYDPVHFESFCVDHGREIISTCDAKGVIRCFHTSGQEQAHYYLDSNTFKGNHCEPGEVHTTWIQVSWSVFGVLIRSIQGIVGVFPHANPCSKLGELDDPVMHPNEAFRATSMFVTENGQYVHWVSSELDSHTLSIWKVATCVSGFPCNPQIASERNKTMNKNLKPCGGRTPLHWVRKISSCTFQLSCNEAASYSDILLYASDTNSSSTIVACSEEVCAFSTPPRFDRIIPLFKLQLGSKIMSMSYHRSNHALLLGDESGVLSWACFPKDGTSLSKLRATPHGLPHFEKANQIRGSVQCFHTAICAIEWILATETLVCANDRFDLALLRSIQAGEHFFTVFRHVTLTFAPIRLNYDGVKAPTQPSDSMDSVPTESRVVEGSLLSSRGEDKNSRRTGYKCNQAPNLTSRFKHLMIKQGVRGDSTRNVSGVNSTTANDSKSARSCRSSPFSGSLNQPQHLESICAPGKIDRQSRNKERIKDGTLSALPGIRNEKREAIPQEPKKRWNHMFRKKMFCPNYREELHMPQTSSSASNYPIGTDSALAASSITKDSARPLQRFLPFELISLRANLSRRGRHGLLCRLQQRSTVQDVVVDHASREIFFQPTNCQETRRARKV